MLAERHFDPEVETRIAQYETAFKMLAVVPDLADISQEPRLTLDDSLHANVSETCLNECDVDVIITSYPWNV